jgi:hypothetical protein
MCSRPGGFSFPSAPRGSRENTTESAKRRLAALSLSRGPESAHRTDGGLLRWTKAITGWAMSQERFGLVRRGAGGPAPGAVPRSPPGHKEAAEGLSAFRANLAPLALQGPTQVRRWRSVASHGKQQSRRSMASLARPGRKRKRRRSADAKQLVLTLRANRKTISLPLDSERREGAWDAS